MQHKIPCSAHKGIPGSSGDLHSLKDSGVDRVTRLEAVNGALESSQGFIGLGVDLGAFNLLGNGYGYLLRV